ncbi:MAG: hypothetical protein H0W96_08045 [Solirubrobacterales bacterium]|nr:hypothetical protein [Solirubrobacterales bacterium]
MQTRCAHPQSRAALRELRRQTIDVIAADVISRCGKLEANRFYSLDVRVHVAGDGSFRTTSYEIDSGDWSGEQVTVDGRQRAVVDVSKIQIAGRFVSSDKAQGTWRAQTVLYDYEAYPASQQPLDQCDTDTVTWQARLKRS